MKQSTILALGATLFASVANAKPMVHAHLHKREMVTVTITEDILEIVNVIITVYNGVERSTGTSITQTTRHSSPSNIIAEVTSSSQPAAVKALASSPTPTYPATNDQSSPEEWQKEQERIQSEHIKEQEKTNKEQEEKNKEQDKNGQPQAQAGTPHNQEQHAASSPVFQESSSNDDVNTQEGGSNGGGKHDGGNNGGGGGPSGGACGQVGGKCMASDVTVYTESALGACGWTNYTESQDFFALAEDLWGSFTNDGENGAYKNPLCGRTATISVDGKQISGTLTDKCPGCTGWSIDLSVSLWNKVYPQEPLNKDHPAGDRKHNVEWWFTGPEKFHGASG